MKLGEEVDINPSGGVLAANRSWPLALSASARQPRGVMNGTARRVLGHATSGPCLQQNLVR